MSDLIGKKIDGGIILWDVMCRQESAYGVFTATEASVPSSLPIKAREPEKYYMLPQWIPESGVDVAQDESKAVILPVKPPKMIDVCKYAKPVPVKIDGMCEVIAAIPESSIPKTEKLHTEDSANQWVAGLSRLESEAKARTRAMICRLAKWPMCNTTGCNVSLVWEETQNYVWRACWLCDECREALLGTNAYY